ncbi:RNA-binding protein 20-like, partial [Plectropomus leopardus]|uniref:RNA-binding protein 20-like n=1 Tax=Plectropomus leopardus TaxID=160734 RepID=UPI001C4D0332
GQDHYSTDENVSSDLNKDDSVVFEEQCDKAGDTSPEPHSSSSSEQSSRARGGRLSSIVSSSGRQTSTRSPRDSKNSPKSSKSSSSPCSEPNKCPTKPSSSVSVDHQTDQQMHDQDNSCEAQRTGPEEGHTLNKESFQVLDSVDHKDRASPDESSEMNSSLQVLDGVTKDQAATGQPYSHLVQDDGFTVKQLSEEDATSTGAKSDSEGKGQETYSVDTHSEQEPTDKGEEDTRPKDEDKSQVIDSLEDQQTTTKTASEPGMKRKGNTRRQVDSVEGELVQDAAIAESFGRRRSARGKNKDDTANDKPTVTTRSTGGKREITAKKDTSNERTKREDMPALRQTPARKQNMEKASKKEEKTPSKGSTLSKRSDSVVKEEGATNKLLDSAEEAAVKDDQPASRRKGQRGRPKKEVKTSESASVKKGDNNATEKVADKDDHVLDSVEDEMVDDQHLTAQKMQRNRSSSRGGGSGGETEKTSRCTKRKHNDDTVLEESMTVDEVEDEKEGVKTRTRGRPNKRTKQTPVRKSTRLKQATVKENEPVGTEALPPSSVNVCSSPHKHLSTLSSDGQPEIQKTEVESASQADVDVASAGQEPNPEIPESQKLEGCLEQGEEEREGWIRADMKVASKWRREPLRREAKRSRCQSPCDAAAVKPSDLLGQEFVVFKSGYFCNLCRVFWPNESTAKNLHCSSQRHHDNLQKYYQKLQQEFVCKKLHTKSSRFNS